MSIVDFDLYNNFPSAVLILDNTGKVVFKNVHFIKTFGKIKNFEKFSNYFSFDICVLDSDDLLRSTPIHFAINSSTFEILFVVTECFCFSFFSRILFPYNVEVVF